MIVSELIDIKIYNVGVLDSSDIYFHTSSSVAKELFFYLLCTGKYNCDGNYVVKRSNYDSFLIMYVTKGKGYIKKQNVDIPLNENEFAFIDCYESHQYYTKTGWDFIWIHFDGKMAREYYSYITSQSGNIIKLKNEIPAKISLEKIHAMFQGKGAPSNPIISKEIVNILTEFILNSVPISKKNNQNYVIDDAIAYIAENIQKPITLNELSDHAFFSPYYFTRLFKKETGYTPHEYIILSRVNLAKFYLKTTNLSIKKISVTCGFSSESSFCTTFKKNTGASPSLYRRNNPE